MTSKEIQSHKRAWTIDRIAYTVLGVLSLAILTRVEKSVELGTQLATWAHIAGDKLNIPFNHQ